MKTITSNNIGFPRALPLFPLPRHTAKKPLRSKPKQHERGLFGRESKPNKIVYEYLAKRGPRGPANLPKCARLLEFTLKTSRGTIIS